MSGSSAENASSISSTDGIHRQRASQTDALLHAARQFARQELLVGSEADARQCGACDFIAIRLLLARDFEAVSNVVDDRAVRQQRERLEHHRHFFAAHGAQFGRAHRRDVAAFENHLSGGRLDQAVEQTHERRFARTGQAHDDEDLARVDGEAHVVDSDHVAGLREDFVAAESLVQ